MRESRTLHPVIDPLISLAYRARGANWEMALVARTTMDHVPPALIRAVPVTRPDDELVVLPVKEATPVGHGRLPIVPIALEYSAGSARARLQQCMMGC